MLDYVPHLLVCHSTSSVELGAVEEDRLLATREEGESSNNSEPSWVTTTMLLIFPDDDEGYAARSPIPPHDQVLSEVAGEDRGNLRSDDVCPVCLCPLAELEKVVRIRNCGHVYCDPCITTWLYTRSARECAMCKRDVRGGAKRDRDFAEDEDEDADADDGYDDWRPQRRRRTHAFHPPHADVTTSGRWS